MGVRRRAGLFILQVNPILCDGFGHCGELAPELVKMDECCLLYTSLVRAMAAGSVVDDDDEAELRRRLPNARVVRVEHAGHSIQGDQPLELAAILSRFAI